MCSHASQTFASVGMSSPWTKHLITACPSSYNSRVVVFGASNAFKEPVNKVQNVRKPSNRSPQMQKPARRQMVQGLLCAGIMGNLSNLNLHQVSKPEHQSEYLHDLFSRFFEWKNAWTRPKLRLRTNSTYSLRESRSNTKDKIELRLRVQ